MFVGERSVVLEPSYNISIADDNQDADNYQISNGSNTFENSKEFSPPLRIGCLRKRTSSSNFHELRRGYEDRNEVEAFIIKEESTAANTKDNSDSVDLESVFIDKEQTAL